MMQLSEVELSVASSQNYYAVIIGPPAHTACTPVSINKSCIETTLTVN